ncbi:MAG: hypothetical protein DDG60_12235 [Anaerolineae bacterium]|nr:MAG: hypothetical protein DDG60_12235 [Anaerolineae bacterium]
MKALPFYAFRLLSILLITTLLATGVGVQPAYALDYTVNTTNDVDDGTCNAAHCSLREAINAANVTNADDFIQFSPSLGAATITLTSTLPTIANATSAGALTIYGDNNSDGVGDITISGNGSVRVISVSIGGNLTLQNLTIANGKTSIAGAGVYNFGTLYIYNSAFMNNVATSSGTGGGIWNIGTVTIIKSLFSNNSALHGGGVYNAGSGTLSINTCYFLANSANNDGGSVYNDINGILSITSSTFQNDSANDTGGSVYNNGLMDVNNSIFASNSATITGGGLYNDTNGSIRIVQSTVNSNNATAGNGGGIANDGMLIIHDSVFSSNTSSGGGAGLSNYGSLTVTYTTFVGNSAGANGGGLINISDDAIIYKNIFENNSTLTNGGGIGNYGTLDIRANTFSGNSATFSGGGIFNDGTLTITNSTFTGNFAAEGGGVFNANTLTLTNNTFSGNSAVAGGGVYAPEGSTTLKNTIIADSSSGGNCFGSFAVGSTNNMATDNTCGLSFTQVTSGLLNLGALTGSPAYFPLNPGSLAVDAGDNASCPTADQPGVIRAKDGDGDSVVVCDIGSFELVLGPLPNSWVGGVAIQSNQAVVAVGRPHLGSQIASYIGASAGSTTQYVPMLFKDAFGGSYKSALYIQNLGNAAANLTIQFINDSGAVVHTITEPLEAKASKGYWLSSIPGIPAGFAGAAKVTAAQPILAVGRPHIGTEVMSYNGVSTGSTTAWLPMYFKNGFGSYNTALYVQNITNNSANLTIEYLNLDGTVACTDNDTLAANASKGYWSLSVTCDSGSLPSGFVGGVKVTSTENILAVGRAHLGTQITSYNGFAGGATTAYVPMLFKNAFSGGSYKAALYLQNVSASSATVTIEYLTDTGSVAATQNVTLAAGAIGSIWLPSVPGLPDGFVGGARITSTQNIIAVGRPHLGSEITAYNGAPLGSTTAYLPMLFKNAFTAPYNAAFYIQNVTGSPATVNISFYDDAGTLYCVKIITLAPNATQGFWTPTTNCAP